MQLQLFPADPQTDALLYGADPTPSVVAVEVTERAAILYRRTSAGVQREQRPFRPWLLTNQQLDLQGARWQLLHGQGLRYLATFDTVPAWQQARRSLRDAHAEHLAYGSPVRTFLVSSGVTLFKGMAFDDPLRLQFDLETEGLSPTEPSARILMVALSDNRGFEQVLTGDEREILQVLVRIIKERDPDVIEGHNLYGFDLPFLMARARHLGVSLDIGRDGSHLTAGMQRNCVIGGTTRPFIQAFAHGRHFIDTLFATQRYDWARGQLESYGLKQVAVALGISEADRAIVNVADVQAELSADEERVRLYAAQDVRETRRLSQIVGATDFYLTQMVPDTYQSVAVTGTGEKIDCLLVREYLRHGRAVPLSKPSRAFPGGLTECRRTGVLRNVIKADVESLYPSLMLTRNIKPSSDELDVFLPALRDLTARRLEAKAKAKAAYGPDAAYWDGVQSSFKILINSFYGYLAGPFHFNDYDAAEAVTLGGQEVLTTMVRLIEESGGSVIELDTDGVYFQPPPDVVGEDSAAAYVARIADGLPDGIRLAYEGSYAAMISLKMKNYVLVDRDGRRTFRGSALRSRSDEPFGRRFIADAVDLLVAGRTKELSALYLDLLAKLREGKLPPDQFARRERVTENTFGAALSKRWSGLLDRVKIGDYVNVYRRANGTLGLLEEYAGDEDREHLAEKLYRFAQRLRDAVGDEFDRLFPKPRTASTADGHIAVQTSFDFG